MSSSLRALAAVCAALAPSALAGDEPRVADELYPPLRVEQSIRFFGLSTDEPDLAKINAALRELDARVVYGPRTTEARPGKAFVAVAAPAEAPAAKLALAVRKGGGGVQELVCVAFEGRDDRDQSIAIGGFQMTSRDFVMGMSGDIVWFDSAGGWSQFYGPPGKLDAEELADRYAKLYGPYGGGKLGEVVRERFTWRLAATPDKKRADKLLKAVRKLDGVAAATLDGASLRVDLALDRVRVSAVAGKIPAGKDAKDELDAAGLGAPRAAFLTRPLWDLLAAEDLAPVAPPAAGGAKR